MRPIRSSALAAIVLALAAALPAAAVPQAGDDGLSDAARRRIEHERTRQAVEDALGSLTVDLQGPERNQAIVAGATALVELGEPAMPFLLAELDALSPATFTFVAYVLGRTGRPEAIPALKRHVELAEAEEGLFAETRKAWALYALGMLGDETALRLLNAGNHRTAAHAIHFDATVAELIATFTAPRSVPVLHELLAAWEAEEEEEAARMPLVQALRRAPDASSLPVLDALLKDDNRAIRRLAARALDAHEGERADALLVRAALEDEDPAVRWQAANALNRAGRPVPLERFVARLGTEPDTNVRVLLYEIVARRGGKRRLPELVAQWGLPAAADRSGLIAALARTETVRAVEPISAGLDDADLTVYRAAATALAGIGSKHSRELLRARIDHPHWERARIAMEELVRLRDAESVEPMVRRLLGTELQGVVVDPGHRFRVTRTLELVLELGPPDDLLERLREPTARQSDSALLAALADARAALEARETPADDAAAWGAHLRSDSAALRRLAVRRLVAAGSDDAARALAGAFEDLPQEERCALLLQLGALDAPAARGLVLRLLADEAYDDVMLDDVRACAARAARLLGGPDMVAALRDSAARRDGRDPGVLYALALLEGRDAIPTLERLRLPRLKYLKWSRGVEQDWLDWTLHQLRAGRPLEAIDVDFRDIPYGSPF